MLYYQSLKKIRKEKKIKIKELAALLGKSRNTIPLWESGKFQPTDAEIRLMAQILNVPLSDISDLKEIKIKSNTQQDISNPDVNGLDPEVAAKLKNFYETCLELRATNTRLRSNIFKYDILLQSLPFIIYVKDKKLKYT